MCISRNKKAPSSSADGDSSFDFAVVMEGLQSQHFNDALEIRLSLDLMVGSEV